MLSNSLQTMTDISVASMISPTTGKMVQPGVTSLTASFASMTDMTEVPSDTAWPFVAFAYITFKVCKSYAFGKLIIVNRLILVHFVLHLFSWPNLYHFSC